MPEKIGPFDLLEQIGVGGMGVVYRAVYRQNGRTVALKLLSPELSSKPKLVARFEREMQILEKLDHVNITRYYGGGVVHGQHFYAMRLMGGTVADLLRQKSSLPWQDAVEYGIQICGALAHAHKRGIIHRDLKPANLFFARDQPVGSERVVLGDFGIARDLEATDLTATGMTVGTYAYMAPEQITGKLPVGPRTDLYALGCVLFEMLTGRTPYLGRTPGEQMAAHLQDDLPPLRELAPACPVRLAAVVQRLLRKDPADRPRDAVTVEMSLEECLTKVAHQSPRFNGNNC